MKIGILKNVCGVESMRQINEKLNEETCIDTLSEHELFKIYSALLANQKNLLTLTV